MKDGYTALQMAEGAGHEGIATLIRNTQQKGAVRAKKASNTPLQASPEKIKKQQEDADRAMKEPLEAEETEKAAAAAGSQKKKQAKAGKSEKKDKTENVAPAAGAAAPKAKVEVAGAVGNDGSAAVEEQDSRLQEGAIVKIHFLQSAAAQQHNGAQAELGKFNPDTGRWQAKLRQGHTLSGVEIAVKPANLLFESGGKEKEERRQEALESQVIQRRRLSQEEDGLAEASSVKKKNKSKKKKLGHQGANVGTRLMSFKDELIVQALLKKAPSDELKQMFRDYRDGDLANKVRMTEEEANSMSDCMGKAEFMDLFRDYVDDFSDPKNKEEYDQYFRANSPCTAAAEEEMREAGAREGCETTRGVRGVLARNKIAAVPKANKGKTRMKGGKRHREQRGDVKTKKECVEISQTWPLNRPWALNR
jgi:hypothetical protein